VLTSVQEVSFEGRNLAYNVPRLFLERAYPFQDAGTVLGGQRAWVALRLRPSLPAAGRRPRRTRGLHELVVVAAERVALAVLVPVDAHALAPRRRQRPDVRAATHLALQRSRPRLRGWAGTGGGEARAYVHGWGARSLAERMRGARVGYLGIRLGRAGGHVLSGLGNVRACNAALLAGEAGTPFFAYAATSSPGAEITGNGSSPDAIGEFLLLKWVLFYRSCRESADADYGPEVHRGP